ncbi:MAG: hypothetical protein ACRDRT_06895, partial [Pseudonocardiaceae bacterium]
SGVRGVSMIFRVSAPHQKAGEVGHALDAVSRQRESMAVNISTPVVARNGIATTVGRIAREPASEKVPAAAASNSPAAQLDSTARGCPWLDQQRNELIHRTQAQEQRAGHHKATSGSVAPRLSKADA